MCASSEDLRRAHSANVLARLVEKNPFSAGASGEAEASLHARTAARESLSR